MFKFLQDIIIKLLKGVFEQLRRIKKNDEERHETKNLSTYVQIDTSKKIYNVIETSKVSTPTEETKQIVTKRRSIVPNNKIYNRKVYMLIDQSGSMVRRDPLFNNERRWNAIAEVIEGHVYNILSQQGMNDENICDEITVTFFSPNRPPTVSRPIQDDAQVSALFQENQPDSNTFLTPAFVALPIVSLPLLSAVSRLLRSHPLPISPLPSVLSFREPHAPSLERSVVSVPLPLHLPLICL